MSISKTLYKFAIASVAIGWFIWYVPPWQTPLCGGLPCPTPVPSATTLPSATTEPSVTPTAKPSATLVPPTPTSTKTVVVLPTDTQVVKLTVETEPGTATVTPTVTPKWKKASPTPKEELPKSGSGGEFYNLLAIGTALVALIYIARRLRMKGE